MGHWIFRTYVSPQGEEEVTTWYAAQTPTTQAAFDQRLHNLWQMTPQEWREPYTKTLEGSCEGLVEIRFKADRVQQRPLGFYGPGRMEFAIVLMAREIGDRFEPRNACEIALARKADVTRNPIQFSHVLAVE
jgi:hypothetical protein